MYKERIYEIEYMRGDKVKTKLVKACSAEQAVQRSRLKSSIVGIDCVDYAASDACRLRDF